MVRHLGLQLCQSHSQTNSVKDTHVQQPYRLFKQVQAEVLRRRRGNTWQKDVSARRADVRKYETDPEYKKKVLPLERQLTKCCQMCILVCGLAGSRLARCPAPACNIGWPLSLYIPLT